MKRSFAKTLFIINYSLLIFFSSCSVSNQIYKQANTILLQDTAISTGHIGISIYEPATNKYWYNYNSTHYFIPASNTKLFTLYAGMKYLGDSLVGLRYASSSTLLSSTHSNHTVLAILPTGDPTFFHPDFTFNPVDDTLKKMSTKFEYFAIEDTIWKDKSLGYGWAWDDYNDDYMVERSPLPIFGNVIQVELDKFSNDSTNIKEFILNDKRPIERRPSMPKYYLKTTPTYFKPFLNRPIDLTYFLAMDGDKIPFSKNFKIIRNLESNFFKYSISNSSFYKTTIPFYTKEDSGKHWTFGNHSVASKIMSALYNFKEINSQGQFVKNLKKDFVWNIIHSQPSDSLFKPMMHRSDNFFAEQTLLMASNEHLGYMNDEKIIDTLLNTDLKDVPQKPKWVDGSGLSRYNLFTPQSLVYILHKMKTEFGLQRMKVILPTGGEGTLSSYYKKQAGFIYAKTGTLSNNCAISGYLITNKGKLLIFSILANNYITSATPIRKAVEHFLQGISQKY